MLLQILCLNNYHLLNFIKPEDFENLKLVNKEFYEFYNNTHKTYYRRLYNGKNYNLDYREIWYALENVKKIIKVFM